MRSTMSSPPAPAISAAPILAALRQKLARVAIINQGVDIAVSDGMHTAAPATIAAIRPAHRDVFFAAERSHAVPAVAGFDVDLGFIDELHFPPLQTKKPYPQWIGPGFRCP